MPINIFAESASDSPLWTGLIKILHKHKVPRFLHGDAALMLIREFGDEVGDDERTLLYHALKEHSLPGDGYAGAIVVLPGVACEKSPQVSNLKHGEHTVLMARNLDAPYVLALLIKRDDTATALRIDLFDWQANPVLNPKGGSQ